MGMLIDGQWTNEDRRRTNTSGEFVRVESSFREAIEPGSNRFPPESGRYHLFINAGCPWAYRTLLYRSIKNLTAHISVGLTEPAMGPEGWTFGDQPEPILGARHIHDVYTAADSRFTGRTTVPVLWDLEGQTIVNNESSEIIRMMNSVFNGMDGVNPVDFYPEELTPEIDRLNEEIYINVNNGVYRCGFAQSQEAYDKAYDDLFETLDRMDERLGRQRYLCGEEVTEADWRFFATLIRFDLAYYSQFRCNRNRLTDFSNLWPYTRDLYQYPGVAETVNVDAIKGIYFGSRPPHIIPKGPEIDFSLPHGRG